MPSAWTSVRSRGEPDAKKRSSSAENTASASSKPPPEPVNAIVAPSFTNAAAAAAVITLACIVLVARTYCAFPLDDDKNFVVPAKAGTQCLCSERHWIPAFAGMTESFLAAVAHLFETR